MLHLSRFSDDPRADVIVELLLTLMNSTGSQVSFNFLSAACLFDTALDRHS
jgi:hypothetical protein